MHLMWLARLNGHDLVIKSLKYQLNSAFFLQAEVEGGVTADGEAVFFAMQAITSSART